MNPVSSPLLATGSLTASHGTRREQLAQAAKQFEAIFLRQMLSAARKADFGEPLLGGQGMETFTTMQDEHFADVAAQSGAFGLAKQIEASLQSRLDQKSPSSLREGVIMDPTQHALPLPQARGEKVELPLTGRGASS